jgi:hypothetical protein
VGWAVGAVFVAFFAANTLGQILGPERTRECTVESISDVYVRYGPDHDVIGTAECGTIEVPRSIDIEVAAAGCDWDIVQVGSRYRMTTRGFEFPFVDQRLVGAVDLVEARPGSRCMSDWLSDDGPVELDVPVRPVVP